MRKILIRYFLYALAVLAGSFGLLILAYFEPEVMRFNKLGTAGARASSESSPIELLQNLLLIASAGIFGWIAYRDRLRRPMALAFVGLYCVFLIRELDYYLDFYAADNLWQVLSALILSVLVVYLGRSRERLSQGWRRSWPSAGLALIFGGLIILIPYAQLMGHEPFWQSIMGDEYVRAAKIITEELIELGGYTLITIGSGEFLYAWSRLPRTRKLHERRRK
jgi:multisubunit Na+/H+ antiporter MnhB subunit